MREEDLAVAKEQLHYWRRRFLDARNSADKKAAEEGVKEALSQIAVARDPIAYQKYNEKLLREMGA